MLWEEFILGEDYKEMMTALNLLRQYARPKTPFVDAVSVVMPKLEKFLARRDAVVADMARAMRLLSAREHRAEIEWIRQHGTGWATPDADHART